jgi:hypothetical protein
MGTVWNPRGLGVLVTTGSGPSYQPSLIFRSLPNANPRKFDSLPLGAADPGTQLREKRASSVYLYGNSQGWLIRATGCYLMQRNTPTSRSIGNKAVPSYSKGLSPKILGDGGVS